VVDEGGNLIEAVNTCPLHGCEKSKDFYEKLAESCHEESDMEPSDPETDDQVNSLVIFTVIIYKHIVMPSGWGYEDQGSKPDTSGNL